MEQQPQRLEFLDSIRGLAALAVLLSHSFIFNLPPTVWHLVNLPVLNILINGKEAVAMFFVLSGFLLSRPCFKPDQPPQKLFLPTFYLRRFTRIWLPWFFAFWLSALAQKFFFRDWSTTPPTSDWFRSFWHVPLKFENVLRQCLFSLHDSKVVLLNQDWSLGVELKASILLPLFIYLCTIWSPWSLLFVSTMLVIFENSGGWYCSFILGVLLARHINRVLPSLQPRPLPVKIGVLISGILFYEGFHFWVDWLGHQESALSERCAWVVTSFGCLLILLASLSSRRIQAMLHLPPLIFLGRISYSVYLLQFIVILCVLPAWLHLLNHFGIQRASWLLPLILFASVSMAVVLSTLSYQWVEQPCIGLGHRLSGKIQDWNVKRLRKHG